MEARPARIAAIPAQQIRGDAALIQKDVLPDVAERLPVPPLAPRRRDIRPALLVGLYRFLTVSPSRSIVRHSVLSAARVGSACCNSASVASGRAVIKLTSRTSSSPVKARPRNFVCFRGAIDPVSRRRCNTRYTQARLTSNRAATAAAGIPLSLARTTRVRRSNEYAAMAPPDERGTTAGFYVQVQNALVRRFGRRRRRAKQQLHANRDRLLFRSAEPTRARESPVSAQAPI